MARTPDYLFGDSSANQERQRLLAMEGEFDAATVARFERLGVQSGWSCLEVGCGAGSILRWLSQRVGADGRVVGLDLDIGAVGDCPMANVSLRQADITHVELEKNAFDLIHARFVFIHVPQRDRAIANLIGALKPGGWLFLEEPDFAPAGPAFDDSDATDTISNVYAATRQLYLATGGDPFLGGRLPGWLQNHGITIAEGEASAALWRGASPRAQLRRSAVERLWPRLRTTGAVTEDELQQFLILALDPAIWGFDYTTVAAWGHR